MSEIESRPVVEGVVVDGSGRFDVVCQAMVESATEFDWEPGHQWSLPEDLRQGLRQWAAALFEWDREVNG